MRTEIMSARAALLAALLLAGAPPLQGLQAPPVPPRPPEAAQAPDAPRGDRVHTGDRTIAEDEVVHDVVVVGGDLRVRGKVTGDAVVVGGSLIMEQSGLVVGDAIITGGEIIERGGAIRGEMRVVDEQVEGEGSDLSSEIKRAVVEGIAAAEEGRAAADEERGTRRRVEIVRDRDDGGRWMDPIRRGFAGLVSTIALGLVLAGIGAILIFYARPYLETVSDTVRGSTLRAGAVGLAASFLVVPVFVVMIVALAVTIIGIPLLIVAVPMYPLALAGAAAFGLLAVAHAIGERTAEQRQESFDLRSRNSYAYLFTGLGMLIAPLIAAHLIGMTGFLGFIGTLLQVVTWAVISVAATFGFGAVILSRAGTRRSFVAPAPDAAFDHDPLFDEPLARNPHV